MRFIRYNDCIFNVDYILRVWEDDHKTYVTQRNGAESVTEVWFNGKHADAIWTLIEECARLENETIQPTVVEKKRNILVDAVLEG